MASNTSADREEILAHIRSIFEAFLLQDKEMLRKQYADDWIGFMGPSRSIERGIDAYMRHVDKSLANYKGTGYEILESDIQIQGDIAIVFYVARYDYIDTEGNDQSMPLRSVDIYRHRGDGWIQAGSHIAVIPMSDTWGESH